MSLLCKNYVSAMWMSCNIIAKKYLVYVRGLWPHVYNEWMSCVLVMRQSHHIYWYTYICCLYSEALGAWITCYQDQKKHHSEGLYSVPDQNYQFCTVTLVLIIHVIPACHVLSVVCFNDLYLHCSLGGEEKSFVNRYHENKISLLL